MEENLKITCEKAQELLFEDRDGNSGPTERMLLSNHLADCDDCREMAELLETGEGLFKAKFEQRLQSGRLLERVLEHHLWEGRYAAPKPAGDMKPLEFVREIKVSRRRTRRVVYSLLAAAAIIAAIVIIPKLNLKSYFALGQIATITRVGTEEMRGEWERLNSATDLKLKKGEFYEFRSSDGSRIRIGGPASLRIAGKREIALNEGVIFLSVKKSKEDFIVKTPDGQVRQLGTEYYVSHTERRTTVAVLEGSVVLERDSETLPLQSAHYVVAQRGSALYSQSFSPDRVALLRQLSAAPEISALTAALGVQRSGIGALPVSTTPESSTQGASASDSTSLISTTGKPLVEIRGRVAFKANGLPVAGANVIWGENPAPPFLPGPVHSIETDSRGRFRLRLPPDTPFFVYAAAGGLYAPVRVSERALEWRNSGELVLLLDLTPAISGSVSSATKQPVEGCVVVIEKYSTLLGTYNFLLQVPLQGGDRPRYVSPPLAEGRYRVQPHVANHALANYRIVTLGTLASDIAVDFPLLSSAGAIRGFIGTPIGAPISGALIKADGTYQGLSDENGAFALTEYREPDRSRIHVQKEGYYSINLQADVPPIDSTPLAVTLHPIPYRAILEGEALRADGSPADGARVYVSAEVTGLLPEGTVETVSDEKGRFDVELPAGVAYRLDIYKDDELAQKALAYLPPSNVRVPFTFRLQKGITWNMKLVATAGDGSAAPLADALVRIPSRKGFTLEPGAEGSVMVGPSLASRSLKIEVEGNNYCRLDVMDESGQMLATVSSQGDWSEKNRFGLTLKSEWADREIRFVLRPGVSANVQVIEADRNIPLPFAQLRLREGDYQDTPSQYASSDPLQTDETGSGTFIGLEKGREYSVLARFENFAEKALTFTEGESTSLTLSLDQGNHLTGVVRDLSDVPIAEAQLTLTTQETLGFGLSPRRSITGADGRFDFYNLPPGDARVRLISSAENPLLDLEAPAEKTLTLAPQTPEASVDFQVDRALLTPTRLEGTVNVSDRDSSAGLELTLIRILGPHRESFQARQSLDAERAFSFAPLPPGNYRLELRTQQPESSAVPGGLILQRTLRAPMPDQYPLELTRQ